MLSSGAEWTEGDPELVRKCSQCHTKILQSQRRPGTTRGLREEGVWLRDPLRVASRTQLGAEHVEGPEPDSGKCWRLRPFFIFF